MNGTDLSLFGSSHAVDVFLHRILTMTTSHAMIARVVEPKASLTSVGGTEDGFVRTQFADVFRHSSMD